MDRLNLQRALSFLSFRLFCALPFPSLHSSFSAGLYVCFPVSLAGPSVRPAAVSASTAPQLPSLQARFSLFCAPVLGMLFDFRARLVCRVCFCSLVLTSLSVCVCTFVSALVLCSLCLLSLGYLSNVALYHRFQADACSVFRSMVSPIHIDLGQHTRPPSPSPFLALSLCCLVFFLLNSFFSFQRCDFSESFYFCLLIFNV